jgi:uncharacterized protein (TIGR03437 family)
MTIRHLSGAVTSVVLAIALQARPAIDPHRVVNAASYYAPGLPGGSIAQGSIFTIFGSALGPAQGISQSSFPLTTTFSNVSIQVTQGSTVVNAIPLYVSESQINAIMPSNAPLGWASVWANFNGKSNPSPIYIVHDSPGIFTFTGTGIGPAAVQNVLSDGTLVNNSYQASATPGQTEQMYLTGLSPISAPDNQPPPAGNVATPVEVWVGDVPAKVVYSGRSPCCSGLDQIDFVVPTDALQGCWVPVYVRTSHAAVSNFASLAISSNGGACSDSSNSLSAAIQSGGSFGVVSLNRMVVHEDAGVNATVDVSNDFVNYTALKASGVPYAFLPFYASPPPGTCTVYPGIGDFLETGSIPVTPPSALDGGTQLAVSGPGGQKSVTTSQNVAPLGSYLPLYSLPDHLYLKPGAYTLTTNGGANVAGFTTSVTVPGAPTWTNRDQITTVDRSQPLTINWSGAVSDQPVTILGVGSDLPTNSSALFFCAAPAGATRFTIPAQVLSALPPSRKNPLASKDVIYLLSASYSAYNASGLSVGAATGAYVLGKTVTFQ